LNPLTAPERTQCANRSASPDGVPTWPRCGPSRITVSRRVSFSASATSRHCWTMARGSRQRRLPIVPVGSTTTGSSAGSGPSASRSDRSMPHTWPAMASAVALVTWRIRSQRSFSWASSAVSAMTISVPGRILMSSSGRPTPASRARMSSAKASASSKSAPCAEKITSACRAAKSRPSAESPAWKITGWPCAERGSVGSTSRSNCSVRARTGVTAPGRAQPEPSGLAQSSAQESQTARATSRNWPARR
jgi:hypothetical protein